MSFSYEYSTVVTGVSLAALGAGTFFSVTRPVRIIFLYVSVLLLFTGTLYGTAESLESTIDPSTVSTIYTRGMGYLKLSLVNVYLVLLFFLSILLSKGRKPEGDVNYGKVGSCITILAGCYLLYILIGFASAYDFENIVSPKGGLGFLNLFLFYWSLRKLIVNKNDILKFEKVFLFMCIAMAVLGLVRLPLGGDPANYYAQYENKNLYLTFFNFGQATIFTIAGSLLLFRILYLKKGGFSDYFLLILFLMNIVFSYRRSAWLGLILVFAWVLVAHDIKRKLLVGVLGLILLGVGMMIYKNRFPGEVQTKVLGKSESESSILQDLKDERGDYSIKQGRFGELYAAIIITSQSPVIGLGPWGLNKEFAMERRSGMVSIVHSTPVFVYMKMGLLGLLPYCFLLISYPVWWIKQRKNPWNDMTLKVSGEAFFCGYIFMLPDILFGTTLINFRHTQILAMVFAIPVISLVIDKRRLNAQSRNS